MSRKGLHVGLGGIVGLLAPQVLNKESFRAQYPAEESEIAGHMQPFYDWLWVPEVLDVEK